MNKGQELFQACYKGDLKKVEELVSEGANDVNKRFSDKKNNMCTPLYIAARKNRVEIVRELLTLKHLQINKGAIVKLVKTSPLFIACMYKNYKVVRVLLEHPQIDVNYGCSTKRQSPLFISCVQNDVRCVDTLLSHPNIDPNHGNTDITPLCFCCDSNFEEIVVRLLDHPKIDVNKGLKFGIKKTPLHVACGNDRVELVLLLLLHEGIQAKLKDDKGKKPLDLTRNININSLFNRFYQDREKFLKDFSPAEKISFGYGGKERTYKEVEEKNEPIKKTKRPIKAKEPIQQKKPIKPKRANEPHSKTLDQRYDEAPIEHAEKRMIYHHKKEKTPSDVWKKQEERKKIDMRKKRKEERMRRRRNREMGDGTSSSKSNRPHRRIMTTAETSFQRTDFSAPPPEKQYKEEPIPTVRSHRRFRGRHETESEPMEDFEPESKQDLVAESEYNNEEEEEEKSEPRKKSRLERRIRRSNKGEGEKKLKSFLESCSLDSYYDNFIKNGYIYDDLFTLEQEDCKSIVTKPIHLRRLFRRISLLKAEKKHGNKD